MGFCPQCRVPDPLVEGDRPSRKKKIEIPTPVSIGDVGETDAVRTAVGIAEIDRILGGGLVEGSVVLVGGEPGVGKSTLLMQAAGTLGSSGVKVLLASAEESSDQVGIRARRLGIIHPEISLLSEVDVDLILGAAEATRPDVLVVDSIQTVSVQELGSAPGSVSQVRESAARLIRFAKKSGVAVVLVGHVTKDGGLAGPKLLEHMVDVVLYLEGDPDRGFRALRSFKNRFGPTHVVALFDMEDGGLVEVSDPSEAFLSEWQTGVAGTVVFPTVEGRRSVLVEIQALAGRSPLMQPRRAVRGLEPSRVHQLLAVLERHCGLVFSGFEVYVNVVGGWNLEDPGSDLPVALALASSLLDHPLGPLAAWGEVGLAGEVRPVAFDARRREEVERLGISRFLTVEPGAHRRLSEVLGEAGLSLPGASS